MICVIVITLWYGFFSHIKKEWNKWKFIHEVFSKVYKCIIDKDIKFQLIWRKTHLNFIVYYNTFLGLAIEHLLNKYFIFQNSFIKFFKIPEIFTINISNFFGRFFKLWSSNIMIPFIMFLFFIFCKSGKKYNVPPNYGILKIVVNYYISTLKWWIGLKQEVLVSTNFLTHFLPF
jgi:hypothetical protein